MLTTAINKARRERTLRAETRLEELVKVAGIPDAYEVGDRPGNLQVEQIFATLYQSVDTEEERVAVAHAFVVWQADERHETCMVRDLSGEAVELLKTGNPLFIDGAFVPADSDGAA